MRRLAAMILAAAISPLTAQSQAQEAGAMRVSEPLSHGNLTVYFVNAAQARGPAPSTLAEALESGRVRVYETGDVNQLMVENLGAEEVFVNAGDIVKGGRQDRVLAVSLIIPAHSGRMPISAFCVEQGRWSARGEETAAYFSSADEIAPLRETRLALKGASRLGAGATAQRGMAEQAVSEQAVSEQTVMAQNDASSTMEEPVQQVQRLEPVAGALGDQGEIWRSVAETQRKLTDSVAAPVAAAESPSSLQLALENTTLKDAQAPYVAALEARGLQEGDQVGAVFAVNGRVVSADIYGSAELFRKMWPKLLRAAALEAISERGGAADNTPPSPQVVWSFLRENAEGAAPVTALPADLELAEKRTTKVVYSETRRAGGETLHRSYLAQ